MAVGLRIVERGLRTCVVVVGFLKAEKPSEWAGSVRENQELLTSVQTILGLRISSTQYVPLLSLCTWIAFRGKTSPESCSYVEIVSNLFDESQIDVPLHDRFEAVKLASLQMVLVLRIRLLDHTRGGESRSSPIGFHTKR